MKEKNIIEMIKENFKEKITDSVSIQSETEFIRDLNFDSIAFMELFLLLESELNISIISSEKNYLFFSIVTIKDLLDALNIIK